MESKTFVIICFLSSLNWKAFAGAAGSGGASAPALDTDETQAIEEPPLENVFDMQMPVGKEDIPPTQPDDGEEEEEEPNDDEDEDKADQKKEEEKVGVGDAMVNTVYRFTWLGLVENLSQYIQRQSRPEITHFKLYEWSMCMSPMWCIVLHFIRFIGAWTLKFISMSCTVHALIHTNSRTVSCAWQVLTRKQQLAMKEAKQREKKEKQELEKKKKEEAKKAKEEAKLAKQQEKERKAAEKTKAKAKARKGSEMETKEDKVEGEEGAKPMAKKRAKKTAEDAECAEDPGDTGDEPKESQAVAKKKEKASTESAVEEPAASKRTRKASVVEETGAAEPKRKVEKKKADAKAAAKQPEKLEEEEVIVTPRKALFQSSASEDEEDTKELGDQCSKHDAPKLAMAKAKAKAKAKATAAKAKAKGKAKAKSQAAGASKDEDADDEAEEKEEEEKPKGRGKKAKASVLSPFAKKEVKRRKKMDELFMKEKAVEDITIQGVLLQHMKNVEALTEEKAVKEYLVGKVKDKDVNKYFKLNEYWKRPAIGITHVELGKDIAYFGKAGTCPEGWNINIALVYGAAVLMAACQNNLASSVSVALYGYQFWKRNNAISKYSWPSTDSCWKKRNCYKLQWCYYTSIFHQQVSIGGTTWKRIHSCDLSPLHWWCLRLVYTLSSYIVDISVIFLFYLILPTHASQAGWLKGLPTKELDDWENPTGKVQTRLFFMKYNMNVAGSKFKPKKWWLGIFWKYLDGLHVAWE